MLLEFFFWKLKFVFISFLKALHAPSMWYLVWVNQRRDMVILHLLWMLQWMCHRMKQFWLVLCRWELQLHSLIVVLRQYLCWPLPRIRTVCSFQDPMLRNSFDMLVLFLSLVRLHCLLHASRRCIVKWFRLVGLVGAMIPKSLGHRIPKP